MESVIFDLEKATVREVNQFLHGAPETLEGRQVTVVSPNGAHNLAVGVDAQYTRVTGILGATGVSQAFGESDLGGTAVRVSILVGR